MSSVVTFDSQRSQDASLDVKGMATQLGLNLAISIGVVMGFQLLRPRNSLIYAPKSKVGTDQMKMPPQVGNGLFDWIKPVLHTDDDVLLAKVGFDAYMFLKILRIFRHILYVMTFIGICGLIPLNIIATSRTGVWPPGVSIDFLSLSTINNVNGKTSPKANYTWYWGHVAVTWIFTLSIFFFFYRGYGAYVRVRQKFFTSHEYVNAVYSKSVLVMNVPKECQSDNSLRTWAHSIGIQSHIQEASIGHNSEKLSKLVTEHEEAVKQLEISLSSYLGDGKGKKKSRPVITTGGFFGCGGRKVDAIEYYTKQSSDLEKEIKQLRAKLADSKAANYGWLAFSKVSVAHSVARRLADGKHFETSFAKELDKPKVLLAPSPQDVIWGNLGMNVTVRRTKRLVGTAIYWTLVFLWIIPITALSATSNIKNFLRLVDPTSTFATNFPVLVGLIEQWFSPIIFSLFFMFFPMMLRFLSQQQGYISQSSLDRQVFSKLYAFFIINNLCIFSLSNMILAIYGQIRNIIVHQGTGADLVESVSSNVNQLAMNLASVSNFWISTETTKALGITMDLAQLVPLVTITLRKFITRPSPRQLQELAKPPEFGYPQNYNLVLFFFTVGLVFSVMSPLILIFTLAYFLIATMTFRYLLLYVYTTKIETGGRMWRSVFNRVLTSTILFHIVMIGILNLKGGHIHSYTLIPLPFLTILFKYLCSRQFDTKADMYIPRRGEEEAVIAQAHASGRQSHLKSSFAEPSRFTKLSVPTVHEDVKHLLPNVYHANMHDSIKKEKDRKTHHTKTNHVAVLEDSHGNNLQFNTVNSDQIASEPLTSAYNGGMDDDAGYNDADNDSRLNLIKTNSQSASHYSERYNSPIYPPEAHTSLMSSYDPMHPKHGGHDGYGLAITDPRSPSVETQYYTPDPEKARQWPNHFEQGNDVFELTNMAPPVPAHEKYEWEDSGKELVDENPDDSTWEEAASQAGVMYDDPDEYSELETEEARRRNSDPYISSSDRHSANDKRRSSMPNIKVQAASRPYDRKITQPRVSTMPLSESAPLPTINTYTRSQTTPAFLTNPPPVAPSHQNRQTDNRWSTMTETGTGSRYDRREYGGGYF